MTAKPTAADRQRAQALVRELGPGTDWTERIAAELATARLEGAERLYTMATRPPYGLQRSMGAMRWEAREGIHLKPPSGRV